MSALLAPDVTAAQEAAIFQDEVRAAVEQLRQRLEDNYTRTYPELAEIIHLVLDQEEARAWQLSPFPHLLFPDLVEAHIEKLNLRARLSGAGYSRLPTREFAFA